jgi:hypothetical protein
MGFSHKMPSHGDDFSRSGVSVCEYAVCRQTLMRVTGVIKSFPIMRQPENIATAIYRVRDYSGYDKVVSRISSAKLLLKVFLPKISPL